MTMGMVMTAMTVDGVDEAVTEYNKVFYPPCSCTLEFSTQTTAAAFGAFTIDCY